MSKRIDVTFGVDLPVDEIGELRARLEGLFPGTVAYCNVFDRLKALYANYLLRLEGERTAYMNIAKEKARKEFFGDQG